MYYEQRVVVFLQNWIVLVLPVTIVLLRLLLYRFAGDKEEMYRNLLTIPQDLTFIAIGFILAGVSRTIPSFATQYNSDKAADLSGFLHILVYLVVAWVITRLHALLTIVTRNLRVCWEQITRYRNQEEFSWKNAPPYVSLRLLWSVFYACGIGLILVTELLIGAATLAESLQHIKS